MPYSSFMYTLSQFWKFSVSFSHLSCTITIILLSPHYSFLSFIFLPLFMAFFFFLLLIFFVPSSNAQWPPSPGYWRSCRFNSMRFYKGYKNLWGPSHQNFGQNALTIWVDRTSGLTHGFKFVRPFRSGYFGGSIKFQLGYTAGVITAFCISNNEAHPGFHDEVDTEFLGTTFGKPYTLQTNVYIRGSGDGRIIGREMKFQ
ncbi:probable xyloglucan endotransglucosylase/hydrolase protein 32 [Quercus lobata]|uniref:probable xyloglucan endotransglucosylase/hydrolase protein 32 n=1 Tax=Quercus lobata TaxID=97700 RepID=UPI001244D22C|nr:probable xyloglucan endotransglucosylase/hydrolase protein 32 [Quercus lobata]XP_030926166.1 probable xyloglucan endotransglucosylase/hydrolase protein 32 [Quercus lobata]